MFFVICVHFNTTLYLKYVYIFKSSWLLLSVVINDDAVSGKNRIT